MGVISSISKKIFKSKNSRSDDKVTEELNRLTELPINSSGYTNIFSKPFKYHHAASFVATYKELFLEELYKFNPKVERGGIILDCGSNMGLSVLYFSLHYPHHQILAFEPEEAIFKVLEENVKTFGLKNVTIYQKAVWTKKETLTFHSDGGMGGRVNNLYKKSNQPINQVETVILRDYLNDKVDFLKIDIEGAEVEVLKSCKGLLGQVNHIFFEYHNHMYQPQTLHELLAQMQEEGFKYHIKESSARKKPFVDKTTICETFDMAITIFCY
ncbi:MAG TPA: FkbM family methyltransferase [Anditalea sp.]|nr:FkbM family methyltransferase [Anditalea sp.]